MTPAEAKIFCAKFAAQLREHFDAVQIMVSWNDAGNTICVKRGAGNWYARQGMAHDLIGTDAAQTNAAMIADALHPEDE